MPNAARPPLLVVEASAEQARVLRDSAPLIAQLLRVAEIRFVDAAPEGAIPYVVEGATLALPVAEFIDLAAERARLGKEVATLGSDIERTARKLDNPDFIARARDEVVEENRERLAEAEAGQGQAGSRARAAWARWSEPSPWALGPGSPLRGVQDRQDLGLGPPPSPKISLTLS